MIPVQHILHLSLKATTTRVVGYQYPCVPESWSKDDEGATHAIVTMLEKPARNDEPNLAFFELPSGRLVVVRATVVSGLIEVGGAERPSFVYHGVVINRDDFLSHAEGNPFKIVDALPILGDVEVLKTIFDPETFKPRLKHLVLDGHPNTATEPVALQALHDCALRTLYRGDKPTLLNIVGSYKQTDAALRLLFKILTPEQRVAFTFITNPQFDLPLRKLKCFTTTTAKDAKDLIHFIADNHAVASSTATEPRADDLYSAWLKQRIADRKLVSTYAEDMQRALRALQHTQTPNSAAVQLDDVLTQELVRIAPHLIDQRAYDLVRATPGGLQAAELLWNHVTQHTDLIARLQIALDGFDPQQFLPKFVSELLTSGKLSAKLLRELLPWCQASRDPLARLLGGAFDDSNAAEVSGLFVKLLPSGRLMALVKLLPRAIQARLDTPEVLKDLPPRERELIVRRADFARTGVLGRFRRFAGGVAGRFQSLLRGKKNPVQRPSEVRANVKIAENVRHADNLRRMDDPMPAARISDAPVTPPGEPVASTPPVEPTDPSPLRHVDSANASSVTANDGVVPAAPSTTSTNRPEIVDFPVSPQQTVDPEKAPQGYKGPPHVPPKSA
jgi:hypothetical protein